MVFGAHQSPSILVRAPRSIAMKVEKVRVQNFRCISDSGELLLDEHLTLLVGTNECGKTAILEALRCFSRGENFDDADVSTLTIGHKLFAEDFDRASAPMVTVWVRLEPAELTQFGIQDTLEPPRVEITKMLDSTHHAKTLFVVPEVLSYWGERAKFKTILEGIRKQLQSVYEGRVKEMRPNFYCVFLEREEDEPSSHNVILFAEHAPNIWSELRTGDQVQVTALADDLFGRNTKALNAGLKVEIAPITTAISRLVDNLDSSEQISPALLKELIERVQTIPKGHPISEHFTQEFMEYVQGPKAEPLTKLPELTTYIESNLPDFVYVTDTTSVVEEIPIRDYGVKNVGAPRADNLVEALGSLAGLAPAVFHPGVSPANKVHMLEQASIAITSRFEQLWPGINIRFRESGQKLAVDIIAEGHLHPPTKRSAGLRSFLALLANVFAVGIRRNAVLLLDDPGVHLHPKKQQDIASFLAEQSFPVIIATHLPYFIRPDMLDGLRLISHRDKIGSRVVKRWQEVDETELLAVFGSLSMQFTNSPVLVVEGKDDWIAYRRASGACKEDNKAHLPSELSIIQGGGAGNVPWTVSALKDAGAYPIALLDGDQPGVDAQTKIRSIPGMSQKAAITLRDIFGTPHVLDDLFTTAEFRLAKDLQPSKAAAHFSPPTLQKLDQVFSHVVKTYKAVCDPSA